MTALLWVAGVCAVIILGPPAAHLVHGALTGKKPSAAEVARAGQIAATPAHPSVRRSSPLSNEEAREFGRITAHLKPGADGPYVPQQKGQS